jgi:molybdopterin molybdotransferase
MDGYAARSEDLNTDHATALHIVESIPAGGFPTRTLRSGECARIFTGAPLPDGADCVIRQEDATVLDNGVVRLESFRDRGQNVRKRGEDITRGSEVFAAGTEIGPPHIAVLASLAMGQVSVHRAPRVAILASGDEIVDLDERDAILAGRKIASSNTYAMVSMVLAAGAVPLNLGIAKDDPDDLRKRLRLAADADMLVTSGGMSVGEHDHLRVLLEDAATHMRFWRLKSRPGAPVGFGLLGGTPWIGLPGNPVSTMVTFELFVRPALRKMMGQQNVFRRTIAVRLGEPLSTPAPLTHFLRVRLEEQDEVPVAFLTGPQGSGLATSMAMADALLVVPQEVSAVSTGETLRAMRLGESVHVDEAPY